MKKGLTFQAITLAFFTLIFSTNSSAQEAIFAQYYNAPMQLNPALTGVFSGQWRANVNYRQQWNNSFNNAPITSFQAGYDYRIKTVDADYFNVGFSAIDDQTGNDNHIKSTRGNFSFSYMKQLGGSRYRHNTQYLVAGGQVGVGQNSLTTDNLWFDRQYDSIANRPNSSLNSGELVPQSNMYLDYNVGLLFYSTWAENRSLYIGASLHHLSQPNVSFFGDRTETLRRRFTLHGGGEIPINKELSVMPSAMITLQGPSMTSLFGANVRYSNHDWNEVAVRMGASFRIANRYLYNINSDGTQVQTGVGILNDALTVTGILELNRWLIGASYDIHTSSITLPTNGRGAWELSLIYTGAEKRRVRTDCPRF